MLPSASRCAQLARRLYVNEPGQSSLKDPVKEKGTPLNNNEMNSLYVNEPGHRYLECTTISHTLERVKKGNISSLKDLLSTKGTPLNRVLRQTSHPELNNNEMNSLYFNESGLYAIILGSNKPKGDVGSFLFSGVYLDVSCEAAAVHALLTYGTCSLRV
jgi:hypothetical protein